MLSIPATLLFLLPTFLLLNNQSNPSPAGSLSRGKMGNTDVLPLWTWPLAMVLPCSLVWHICMQHSFNGFIAPEQYNWNTFLLYYEHVYFICLSALVMFAESIWLLFSGSLGAGMHCILARDGILSTTCLRSFPVHSHVGCFDVFAFTGRR